MSDFDAMLFGHQKIAKIFHLFIRFVMKSLYGPAKVWLNKIILGVKKKTEQKRRGAVSRMNCPNKTPKPFCSWIYVASVFFGIAESIDVWGDKKNLFPMFHPFFPQLNVNYSNIFKKIEAW
jgi:hypothetical protein